MLTYSTNEAARKLGITGAALSKYIKANKIPSPKVVQVGKVKLHSWTEDDIAHVRQLLPKIKNGRKTRYKKKQLAISNQQSAKAESKAKPKKQPPPRAAVPHEQRSQEEVLAAREKSARGPNK